MRCHSCGVDVREGQKFCMECGASLRGVADITGEVPIVRAERADEEATRELATVPPPPPPYSPPTSAPAPPPTAPPAADVTAPIATTAPVTGSLDVTGAGVGAATATTTVTREAPVVAATPTGSIVPVTAIPTGEITVLPAPPGRQPGTGRRFRVKPLLVLALAAGAATAAAVLLTVIEVAPPPDGTVPEYAVNDFGTNNTVAGVLAAGMMVLGALAWCAGRRWGAGLAGGAGASLAGWAALVLGAAEWRLELAAPDADATRQLGYWGLAAAGVLGILVLVASFGGAGRDGRSGLDPWIAALAAVSFVIAAGGPLIPEGTADWASNWTGNNPADLPTMFFVGRLVQLGLLLACGVLGCLLVRRWGLGLAVGGALAAGWLLVTAATDRTPSPIGPGYSNPPFVDSEPHGVTIVGFALAGFFALVAVVMALLDAER
jgi:hypothetical protein